MDSHGLLLAKAAGRALVAAIAVGSLLVLLDAGANYSGLGWRAASSASEPSGGERETPAPGSTPHAFRLSANLPLEHIGAPCGGAAQVAPASADGDESFDSSCSGGATVNAVGDLPRAELLSLPGDWLYHRALRF
jgi:hypothetical protein